MKGSWFIAINIQNKLNLVDLMNLVIALKWILVKPFFFGSTNDTFFVVYFSGFSIYKILYVFFCSFHLIEIAYVIVIDSCLDIIYGINCQENRKKK